MLTLSVMVLVFLVGYYLGVRNTLTRVDIRALEEIRELVDHWERPCPHCGATAGTFQTEIEGRHQRACNSCLRATHVFVPLDDGR